jgi:TetR/AcrR family transcriptional repressor of nem operon
MGRGRLGEKGVSRDGRSVRKARSHEAIVSTAARLLREKGSEGISVDDVMKDAGLTRGGFYAHFADKDALVIAALERAFAEQRKTLLDDRSNIGGSELLEAMVGRYLSVAHLEHVGMGCPVPPLAGEIGRSGKAVKAVFRANVKGLVAAMKKRIGGSEEDILAICAMAVGAMTLARAVGDDRMANELLGAARRHLLRAAPSPSRAKRRRRRLK